MAFLSEWVADVNSTIRLDYENFDANLARIRQSAVLIGSRAKQLPFAKLLLPIGVLRVAHAKRKHRVRQRALAHRLRTNANQDGSVRASFEFKSFGRGVHCGGSPNQR